MLFLCSILSIITTAELPPADNLGQNTVRENYFSSMGSAEMEEDFRTKHYYLDVAEKGWSDIFLHQKFPEQASHDPDLSFFQWSHSLTSDPLRVYIWLPAGISFVSLIGNHPFATISALIDHFKIFELPFFLALLICFLAYLNEWKAAIFTQLPNGMRGLIFFALEFLAIFFAATFHCWPWFLYLNICLCLIYSKKRQQFFWIGLVSSLLLSCGLFFSAVTHSFSHMSAVEAIRTGRTRLEYSATSLENLNATERTIWSVFNHDESASRFWFDLIPNSKEKEMLQANLASTDLTKQETAETYEALHKKYSDDSTILFNLIQLEMSAQNLVRSDELRAQMNTSTFDSFAERASAMGQIILPPTTGNIFVRWSEVIRTDFFRRAHQVGWLPFRFTTTAKKILFFLLPWILFFFALFYRRRAVGVCQHTGEITSSPSATASQAYENAFHKHHSEVGVARQQIDRLLRHYSQNQMKKVRWRRWIIPGISEIIFDRKVSKPFLKIFAILSLAWIGLSRDNQMEIFTRLHLSTPLPWDRASTSTFCFILAIALYFYFTWREKRSAHE